MQPNTQNELITVFIVGISILLFLSGYIVYFVYLYQKKVERGRTEKKMMETEQARQMLQSQLEIKEQTLQHIAFELHDNLGQIASLIKINLNTLQWDQPDKAMQKIEDTKELIRQLLLDLKSLSLSLNSAHIVQSGIVKSLEIEVDRLNKTGQFSARLTREGDIPVFEANTTIILFRMVQEMLNNAIKHSNAKHIHVSLKASGNLFTLYCLDDGTGFNDAIVKEGSGSGLINLQNRAKLINGKFWIESVPGKGSRVFIELPIY